MVSDGHEHSLSTYLRAWAGFLLGGLAVSISMQANYAVATTRCDAARLPVMGVGIGVLLVSAVGFWMSFSLAREVGPRPSDAVRLTARVSAAFAVLMGMVVVLHLLAALIFGGCET